VHFTPLSEAASIAVRTRPGTQLLLRAGPGGPVKVALRRFADAFTAPAVGTLDGARSAVLSLPLDQARTHPWYVLLSAAQPIDVCAQ
jgi:hypothetical protein